MDLFLDFDYKLDCEFKFDYEKLLTDGYNYNDTNLSLRKEVLYSNTNNYYYQVKINDTLYKTITIQN